METKSHTGEAKGTGLHTPLPWKWCGCGKCGYITKLDGSREICIALTAPVTESIEQAEHPYWCSEPMPSAERNANAELIVTACNAYPDLLKRVSELEAALEESYCDNLYNALHAGVEGNGKKWWPGGMSDAEWFARQAGISYMPEFTKEELIVRVPEIAKRMIAALGSHP